MPMILPRSVRGVGSLRMERLFLLFANPENLPHIMPSTSDTRIERLNLVPPPSAPIRRRLTRRDRLAALGQRSLLGFATCLLISWRAHVDRPRHGIRVEPLLRRYPGEGALRELASPARV